MPQFPSRESASGIWTLKKQKRAQQGSNWPLRTFGDSLWNYVTALFKTTSTNGAQNNTFLDSSTNNFSITRNGNTTQGSFSPYGSLWSNYFDGSGDYLTIADNAALQVGSGDFTFEAWVYPLSLPSAGNYKTLWSKRATGAGYGGACLVLDSSGNYVFFVASNSTTWGIVGSSSGQTATLNQWQHLAMVRSGNNLVLYKNGAAGTTVTLNFSVYDTSSLALMAGAADGIQAVDGYMSNFRLVKGTAVYTSAFTPPTAPLTAISGTSLLTCADNRFIDDSANNFAITRTGDVSVQRFSPFGSTDSYSATTIGGSGYFDGSGDYLTVASNAAFAYGTGDFTTEFWFFPTNTTWSVLFDSRDGSGAVNNIAVQWSYTGNTSKVLVYANQDFRITSTNTFPTNAWMHIAVVRSGTTLTLYVNGTNQGTYTYSTNVTASQLYIGEFFSTGYPTSGYISGLRMVKGTAVYTSAFTPPTAPPTAITNTSLLLNFTNGNIFDGAVANDFETVGNAQVSTTQAKYGTTSMYFDGTGDYLTTYATPQFAFGTGNFTIECWVYFNSLTQYDCIIDFRPSGTNGAYPCIFVDTSNTLVYYVGGGNRITSSAVSTGQWYHLAISRAGTDTKMFLNGAQTGSTYSDSNNYLVGNPLTIGGLGYNSPGTYALDGYLDDLRITKGYARYWYPFTPPIATLPDFYEPEVIPANDPLFDYTTLLLSGNGTNGAQNNTFLDSSTNNFTITRNGNTTQGTFTPYGSNWSNYFDGSGDYLSLPSSTNLALGTGAFTIEAWVFNSSTEALFPFIGACSSPSGITQFGFANSANSVIRVVLGNLDYPSSGNSILLKGSASVGVGQWAHVAYVRDSGVITIYLNGVSVGTVSDARDSVQQLRSIGASYSTYFAGLFFEWLGYISNLRFVKGSAVYTSAFTPSTAPITAITNTQLLTCQNNRFIDNSSNAFAITINGNTSVQRFSPFNPTTPYAAGTIGGSGYFDGSGDFLTAAQNAAFSLGTGAFTVEAWVYLTANNTYNRIIGLGIGASGSAPHYTAWALQLINLNPSWYRFDGTETAYTSSSTASLNTWNHVVAVRDGSNNFAMFLNGVRVFNQTVSLSYNAVNSDDLYVGRTTAGGGTPSTTAGYISDTRVVKGSAVYDPTQSTLTVPTAPLTAITNTSLLLSTTNAGIIDNAMMNDLETVGNAQISTSVSKFGGGSIAFDGSGDALALPANVNLAVESGDFTIEMWVNGANNGSTVGGSYPRLFTLGTAQTSGCIECYNAAGTMYIEIFGISSLTFTASTLLNSTWNHYAITRSGTSLRAFVNGTQVGTTVTNSTNLNRAATTQSWIGAISASAGNLNGYIDDFRITKGYARYVQPFTPPTQAFQTS